MSDLVVFSETCKGSLSKLNHDESKEVKYSFGKSGEKTKDTMKPTSMKRLSSHTVSENLKKIKTPMLFHENSNESFTSYKIEEGENKERFFIKESLDKWSDFKNKEYDNLIKKGLALRSDDCEDDYRYLSQEIDLEEDDLNENLSFGKMSTEKNKIEEAIGEILNQ